MDLVFRHAWILFIGVTIINGLIFRQRAQRAIEKDPVSKGELDKLINGWFLYANIPWFVMAVGELSGSTRSVFDYFQPRSMNPAVLTFHVSVVVVWILSAYWIYFNEGARSLARHWAIFSSSGGSEDERGTSPARIKVMLALVLASGVVGLWMMWFTDLGEAPSQ